MRTGGYGEACVDGPCLQEGAGGFFGRAFACVHVSGLLMQRVLLAKMVCAAGNPINPATLLGRCFARFISRCRSNDPVHLSVSCKVGFASLERSSQGRRSRQAADSAMALPLGG